jgi:hypothetical protein
MSLGRSEDSIAAQRAPQGLKAMILCINVLVFTSNLANLHILNTEHKMFSFP